MRLLRKLLWVVLLMALVGVAAVLTSSYDVRDRLITVFIALRATFLPIYHFEQFLVVVTISSLLLAVVGIGLCVLIAAKTAAVNEVTRQREITRVAAAQQELQTVKEHALHSYQELLLVARALTKRFDKRVLIQTIIESASRLTSVAQANGVVSCWLLNVETNTIRFEKGLYCDETVFAQTEFQPTEPPFAHVFASQQPWTVPTWNDTMVFVKREKRARFGAASSLLLIPLMAEEAVIGVLVIFCHPDILKLAEQQQPFFDAMWGELAMGLAIAVEGEVSILDRLTGTHNREYFAKRLIQEIERANRFQLPLSLLMIDIDNFKLVNDTLGHPQGDVVLRVIAKLIKREVRAIDLVGRYGGEEFVVMLPETGYGEDAVNSTGALAVAERVRKSVDEEFCGLQKPLNLTISVGLSVRRFPEDREVDYQTLIRTADVQLYRAKTSGKNKVCSAVPPKPQTVS